MTIRREFQAQSRSRPEQGNRNNNIRIFIEILIGISGMLDKNAGEIARFFKFFFASRNLCHSFLLPFQAFSSPHSALRSCTYSMTPFWWGKLRNVLDSSCCFISRHTEKRESLVKWETVQSQIARRLNTFPRANLFLSFLSTRSSATHEWKWYELSFKQNTWILDRNC